MPTETTIKKPTTRRAPASASAPAHHAAGSARYTEAIGRRKTAVARVRLIPKSGDAKGTMTVNGGDSKKYFGLPRLLANALSPLVKLDLAATYDVTVKVMGGGLHAQADAIRLGISRAIVKITPDWKKRLRAMGYMTRDSRMVERKKYGLKKARRSPQWAKR